MRLIFVAASRPAADQRLPRALRRLTRSPP